MTQATTAATIRSATLDDLPQVSQLWHSHMEVMKSLGMQLKLKPDAAEQWTRSVRQSLDNKWVILLVADAPEGIVGFVYVTLRMLPPYYEGGLAAFWHDFYIKPDFRGTGLADEMADVVTDRVRSLGAGSIEAQGLVANDTIQKFLLRRGWQIELVQMRKVFDT